MVVIPNVRLATPADALSIAEMSRRYIEHGLGWSWTRSRVLWAMRDSSTNVAVVHETGALAGFGIMHYGEQSAHLSLLAVYPTRRRRGLAARLLSWLEKCAETAGIEHVLLEARADNPGAISFYQRCGYQSTHTIAGYYRGVLDAVRLQKRLWDRPSERSPRYECG